MIAGGSERAAKVISNPIAQWLAPFAESRWISAEASRGDSSPGTSQLAFERCFCISENAGEITLDLELRADDSATVLLNGVRLGEPGARGTGAPLRVTQRGGFGASSRFRIGSNCLRVDVSDTGGVVTGLDLAGSVRAENGACDPP